MEKIPSSQNMGESSVEKFLAPEMLKKNVTFFHFLKAVGLPASWEQGVEERFDAGTFYTDL